MKCFIFVLSVFVVICCCCGLKMFSNSKNSVEIEKNEEIITVSDKIKVVRIHIRANSNSEIDQNIKFFVKDKVASYIENNCMSFSSFNAVENFICDNKTNITAIANKALREKGFSYSANCEYKKEFFPTRQYDNIVFESGNYNAIIVNLGSGSGNNWWCVVYPPLCFINSLPTDNKDIQYKSKIIEYFKNK